MNFSIPETPTLLITGLCVFLYVCIWAIFGIHKQRADLADIAWGLGFFLVAWTAFFLSPFSYIGLIVDLMVTIWAFRLALHITRRNRNKPEDYRYKSLKEKWGKNLKIQVFLKVFILQGALLYMISLPILWINNHPEKIEWDQFRIGFIFWLIGFFIETIADNQLARFKKDVSNRGKLLMSGLWGVIRHPNYLGELIQWWGLWMISLNITLLISPLLITFLIVKVSGIPLLEDKMKSHPDFPKYAEKIPSLISFPMMNGMIYTIASICIIYFGGKNTFLIPLFIFFITYGIELLLFVKYDTKSLSVSLPLSIYAVFFGFLQETLFINLHLLQYPDQSSLPPLWLLSLYALFALNLNCSCSFINKNLYLTFVIGGVGAIFSYIYAEQFGSVRILSSMAYPLITFSWGLYFTILVLMNRKINQIRDKYISPDRLETPLTVFFDQNCPVCSLEMKKLQMRKQSGKIIYECLVSEEEFKRKCTQVSYESAMKKIKAIDSHGEIFEGIHALSEIYARTNLVWISILLQSPGLRPFFMLGYGIWAKFRKYL
jgi:steroid 5-alpha reductase family enzyme/predicted DCC family thiol-disulfide oxidoreductase YuxK